MNVVLAIVVLVAIPTLAMIRLRGRRRRNLIDEAPQAPGVLLSVLPDRTAVVTLAVTSDASSAAVALLVDEAVRDAFALGGVDDVEVRRSDGQLLDRRRRPAPRGTSRSDLVLKRPPHLGDHHPDAQPEHRE